MGRGFEQMTPEERRSVAAAGGRAAHASGRAHEFTQEEAREAGRRGGMKVSADREHMAAIGRRGGKRVSVDRTHMSVIGRLGGVATAVTTALKDR